MADSPAFPKPDQHVAIAGMTGSGKTVGALNMMVHRLNNNPEIPWVVIDHKRDPNLAKLPAEKMSVSQRFLPGKGLFIIRPSIRGTDKPELEALLERMFKAGKWGIFVDEGHLMGKSPAINDILVAGRAKRVVVMWCSQRAQNIDPFVWSQSTFYRVYQLQTGLDVKRFNENFPVRYFEPQPYHSHYYDGTQRKVFYLGPSPDLRETISLLDVHEMREHKRI